MALKWIGNAINVGLYGGYPFYTTQDFFDSFRKDMQRLKSSGFTMIRIGGTDPAYGTAYGSSKTCALIALEEGMEVILGITKVVAVAPLSTSNWATHKQNILNLAQWCQDNGVQICSIGNEEEEHINGTFTVSQIQDNYKSVAVEAQAIAPDVTIIYSATAALNRISEWDAKGITPGTDIDKICFQPYGGNQYDLAGFKTQVTNAYNAFGTDTWITEWNLFYNWGSVTMPEYRKKEETEKRLKIIEESGIERAYYFTYKRDADEFAVQRINNQTRDYFYALVTDRHTLPTREEIVRDEVSYRHLFRDMGKSAVFSGGSGITVPVVPSPSGFNIAFWVLKQTDGNNDKFVDCCDLSGQNGFDIRQGAGSNLKRIALVIKNAGVSVASIFSSKIPTGQFYFVTATYEPNNTKLFINGVLEGSDTSCTMGTPGGILTLGKSSAINLDHIKTLMNTFVFKNGSPWTDAEINKLMYESEIPIGSDVHYSFNDTVEDQTINGNDGTASSITYSDIVPFPAARELMQ